MIACVVEAKKKVLIPMPSFLGHMSKNGTPDCFLKFWSRRANAVRVFHGHSGL